MACVIDDGISHGLVSTTFHGLTEAVVVRGIVIWLCARTAAAGDG
jgi:hypothetical protein